MDNQQITIERLYLEIDAFRTQARRRRKDSSKIRVPAIRFFRKSIRRVDDRVDYSILNAEETQRICDGQTEMRETLRQILVDFQEFRKSIEQFLRDTTRLRAGMRAMQELSPADVSHCQLWLYRLVDVMAAQDNGLSEYRLPDRLASALGLSEECNV